MQICHFHSRLAVFELDVLAIAALGDTDFFIRISQEQSLLGVPCSSYSAGSQPPFCSISDQYVCQVYVQSFEVTYDCILEAV